MQKLALFWTLFLAFMLSFSAIISCGCHDDDDERDEVYVPSDDDVNDDSDDDVDDDVDDYNYNINPFPCLGLQVNDGSLDEDNDNDGYSETTGDCNDAVNAVNPDAQEVFDGVDNNCDGIVDEGFDEDCDGFQSQESGGNDCDDLDLLTNPDSPELPDDGIDQNCDGDDLLLGDDTGVFVAPTGDDVNPGTMTSPLRTINAGATRAAQVDKSVFVAVGNYTEHVETKVSLFGGYNTSGWAREINGDITTINAQTSTAVKVVESHMERGDYREETKADDARPVAIQGFTINGGLPYGYENRSYGVHNYITVTLVRNDINGGGSHGGSYGVYNEGMATLANNVIDGGSVAYYRESNGVYNDDDGSIILANNTINGGTGGEYSNGIRNIGMATLTSNIINGGSGRECDGVNNDGIAALANNDINGGSGTESYGVNNYGMAALANNNIDGGVENGTWESYGVYNSDDGNITLMNNNINGGSGIAYSNGMCNSGTAMLVDNVIDAGSPIETEEFLGCRCVGVANYGTMTMRNNTIDGGSPIGDDDESYGVRNGPGGTGTATLVNNIIKGGSPTGENSYSYGVFNGQESTITLENNTISGGSGGDKSYGIFNVGIAMLNSNNINGGSPTSGDSYGVSSSTSYTFILMNNVINGGSGINSYGVQAYYGTAMLANNVIMGGYGSSISYGVYNTDTARLVNNVIMGGFGTSISCGVYDTDKATLVNNVINGGSGSESYGVHSAFNATTRLANNNIWGLYQECLLYNGSIFITQLAVLNDCEWTGCAEAHGNISDNPLFVDPDGSDFHIQDTSPCIDTGIDPSLYIDPTLVEYDFDGDARPYGAGWDIGADEWTP